MPEARCILKDDSLDEQSKVHNGLVVKQEVSQDPVSSPPVGRISPTAAQKDESSELTSPDISTINRPLFNSTPITGSALFDVSSPTTQSSSRKPFKNYDVDTKRKPRYICNYCQYGTENYKTIHNHMYRHERIKYLCPYCGFKRAPRYMINYHFFCFQLSRLRRSTEITYQSIWPHSCRCILRTFFCNIYTWISP